jgi:hypothetical protein
MPRRPDTAARLAAVDAAITAALTALEQEPDKEVAIKLAAELRDRLARGGEEAVAMRGELARQVWMRDRLSLAQLAQTLGGVTPARASQILSAAKTAASKRSETTTTEGTPDE